MHMIRQIVLAFGLIFALASTAQAAATAKTGVIDVARVIQQMPETKKAENVLKSSSEEWEKALNKMKVDFQTAAATYEKGKAQMNQATRAQKEKALETQLQAAQKFQLEKFGQGGALQTKQEELFKPIRQKVLAAIEAVSKKEGFSMVLDKQAMIYGDPSLDLTIRVIDHLNKK